MTTALAVRKELTPDTWKMIGEIAPTMARSRLFGVAAVEQAAAIMLKGHELGLPLTASFDFINVIDGKPSLNPRGALAILLNSPEFGGMDIKEEADSKNVPVSCTVTLKRKNGMEYTARFSMDDAKRAGLVKEKSGWEKYPAQMLKWRAVGYAIDVLFPDVTGGLKRADEYGADITPDGEVIEGSWKVETAPAPERTVADALNDLIAQYGAEPVVLVSNGSLPTTFEGIAELEGKLQEALAENLDNPTLGDGKELDF